MPDGIFLRLDSPTLKGRAVRPPLLCLVCGVSVPELPRLPQLAGLSPAEVHEDRHRRESDPHNLNPEEPSRA